MNDNLTILGQPIPDASSEEIILAMQVMQADEWNGEEGGVRWL